MTTDGHHNNTENHCREKLLMGWEWVPLQNGELTAMLPPGQMEQQRNNKTMEDDGKSEQQGGLGETTSEEGKQRKKGPRDIV